MKLSYRRTILSLIPAVVATTVYTAPASALGRSSAPSTQSPVVVQTVDRLSRVETEQKTVSTALQSQIVALRQELAALKTRVELQDVASAE